MPAISITDDQRERLRWIQTQLAEDVDYGHVRPRDALEFLLDRFDENGEPVARGSSGADSASTADSTPMSAGAGDDSTEVVVMNGGDVAGRHTVLDGTNSDDPTDDGDTADESDSTAVETDGADGADDVVDEDSTDGRGATEAEGASDADSGADGTRLNAVMSLLDDHDGKWREAGGGEEKYEVDLPDGGTERARTKDDVRAVLFKHYR